LDRYLQDLVVKAEFGKKDPIQVNLKNRCECVKAIKYNNKEISNETPDQCERHVMPITLICSMKYQKTPSYIQFVLQIEYIFRSDCFILYHLYSFK